MIFYEPQRRDKSLFPHDPFKALVVPRPIGWISTLSAKGELNLAPYSYFNAFSSVPPIVGFSSEGEKDSSSFALETGEFVWSMATWELRDPMNASAASPAAFECRVTELVKLKDLDGSDSGRRLVLGRVVGIHLDQRFVRAGRVDSAAMRPIARGGYDEYSVVERVFSMPRPA
ncbi:MAG: flavin reductase family protein [Burkholderiales bacterium]